MKLEYEELENAENILSILVQCLIGLNIDEVLLNADMFFVKKFSK